MNLCIFKYVFRVFFLFLKYHYKKILILKDKVLKFNREVVPEQSSCQT